ncbi:MAG: hypothetical protein RMJ84_11535 [Sandaracinaceae bacterium]|nr:hypothetical protein [Sandaracinaceae bacterium]
MAFPKKVHAEGRVWGGGGYVGIAGDTPYAPHAVSVEGGGSLGVALGWDIRYRLQGIMHGTDWVRIGGSFDVLHRIDVIALIPYFGIGLGAGVGHREAKFRKSGWMGVLETVLLLGAEFFVSFDVFIGIEGRVGWVWTEIEAVPLIGQGMLRLGVRLE